MTRHNLANAYVVDPDARLRVWAVAVEPVNPDDGGGIYAPRVRVPAYTAAEAAQVGATMSGLPREAWAAYFFIPECREEETP